MQDYYSLLGVSHFSSEREIARAYRRRAVSHHRNRVILLKDQLNLMHEAFETLTDSERRRSYDAKRDGQLGPVHRSEDARLRREGMARVELAREIGRSSEVRSLLAVAANAEQMRALADEHQLREELEARARRWRDLVRNGLGLVVLCALVALAWYLAGR